MMQNSAYIYNRISRWPLCFFDFNCLLQLLSRSALLTYHQFSGRTLHLVSKKHV